ncbi:unnamed protein product, partial [Choristocarpus tenellus]
RAALVAAARGGLAEEAVGMMKQMEDNGFSLGAVEYGTVMEALERNFKPQRVLHMFDEMVSLGIEPDVLCYAVAARCCRYVGNWKRALQLLDTTLHNGLLPNRWTFQAVAKACLEDGQHRALWDLKERMRLGNWDGGMPAPDAFIYMNLMQ